MTSSKTRHDLLTLASERGGITATAKALSDPTFEATIAAAWRDALTTKERGKGAGFASLGVAKNTVNEVAVQRAFAVCRSVSIPGGRTIDWIEYEFPMRPKTRRLDLIGVEPTDKSARWLVELKYASLAKPSRTPLAALLQILAYTADALVDRERLNSLERHEGWKTPVLLPDAFRARIAVVANQRWWSYWRTKLQDHGCWTSFLHLVRRLPTALRPYHGGACDQLSLFAFDDLDTKVWSSIMERGKKRYCLTITSSQLAWRDVLD